MSNKQNESGNGLSRQIAGFRGGFQSVVMATVSEDGLPESSYRLFRFVPVNGRHITVSGRACRLAGKAPEDTRPVGPGSAAAERNTK